ncbi:MFS transporter [Candidatus Bathyarchaeota archaeon]|nr:MFS transporter [Candidatus Bathyarchaeota archaeon]
MRANSNSSERVVYRRLFLSSLVVSSFATGPITVLAALLLIDIGNTFNTSVGVTGQINTAYSVAAFIFALLTGVLSVRFKHKSLLLTGVLLMAISALGCFLALDFRVLLVFFSLSGAGYAMVNPMAFTLVGEHFPLEKRANAIGWIVAGGALVYVIGAPIIALISGFEGWRFPLLWFVLPVLFTSLLMAFLGLPSASKNSQTSSDTKTLLNFKDVLLNRSAVACLIGDILRSAAFVAIVLYATSFFRQRFLIPTDLASLILLGGALSYVLGSLTSGLLVNRFGRKTSTVLTALLSGIFTVAYVFTPNLWLSLVLMLTASWFFGMVASSANSLTLEQVPRLRGTMMSIDTAVINIGSALGTMSGGLALLYLDYEGLGSVLGAIGIVAAIVFYLLAKDPTKSS